MTDCVLCIGDKKRFWWDWGKHEADLIHTMHQRYKEKNTQPTQADQMHLKTKREVLSPSILDVPHKKTLTETAPKLQTIGNGASPEIPQMQEFKLKPKSVLKHQTESEKARQALTSLSRQPFTSLSRQRQRHVQFVKERSRILPKDPQESLFENQASLIRSL